ncbi:MAG: nucleotidyltransferase domain-containing protein, partial [Chryseolinea sp.]
HHATSKLGRGENFEALDFLTFVRLVVIAPLLQIKNGRLPRGLRKVEFNLHKDDLKKLVRTVAEYNITSIFGVLENTIELYQELRLDLYPDSVVINSKVEGKTLAYFEEIKRLKTGPYFNSNP